MRNIPKNGLNVTRYVLFAKENDMAKDRYAVTCNGRSAFYACMYEDIRQCARVFLIETVEPADMSWAIIGSKNC